MYQTRSPITSAMNHHHHHYHNRSGNGPVPSLSPNAAAAPRRSTLLPHYDASSANTSSSSTTNRRRYPSRASRHLDSGLSQMLMNHRGSMLSTASLAFVGAAVRRSSLPDIEEGGYRRKSKSPLREDEDDEESDRFWPRAKQCVQYVYEKSRLKNFLPLLILVGYSFLGGAAVYWIEAPYERSELEGKQRFLDDQKDLLAQTVWDIRQQRFGKTRALMNLREAVHWYTTITMYLDGNLTRLPPSTTEIVTRVSVLKKYTEEMAQRCWEIRLEKSMNRTDVKRKIEDSLKLFELFTGVSTEVRPIWTFSNALFLAVTIYTTIGYGSVAPHTVAGRVATIIYAIIGIPVYLMILHKLGRVFLKLLHKFWSLTLRFAEYLRCWRNSIGNSKHSSSAIVDQDQKIDSSIVGGGPSAPRVVVNKSKLSGVKKDSHESTIPVSLAVGVTFLWMLTCAGVCCLFFETSWDYFTSFYFFFISLTTIGFGDVTPTHPEYMFTMFGLIIVGLSLVSMCINVVQLKLELLFEEMMLALMEEYEKTGQVIDGDMMESALLQRGLGVFEMMKLWTRKKRHTAGGSTGGDPLHPTAVEDFGEALRPFAMRKRRGRFLRELQRKRRSRTIGTQTEMWFGTDYGLDDSMSGMSASMRRRRLKKLLVSNEATQTDSSSSLVETQQHGRVLVAVAPGSHLPMVGSAATTGGGVGISEQNDSMRSASSSMITCGGGGGGGGEDSISAARLSCAVTIDVPSEGSSASSYDEANYSDYRSGISAPTIRTGTASASAAPRIRRPPPPPEDDEEEEEEDEMDSGGSSKSSTDLIPFIPYIEQEVPPEHEMDQPFRRWSAAEAMSVFANWAANRDLRRQSRQSRRSSHGDQLLDDGEHQLERFRSMRRVGGGGGRRMTVAVAAPQAHSVSSLRLKRLDYARSRAEGAISAMRMGSREPSSIDLYKPSNSTDQQQPSSVDRTPPMPTQSRSKPTRLTLNVENPFGLRKISDRSGEGMPM